MYNRAFPVGNALFLFAGGMMSLRTHRFVASLSSYGDPAFSDLKLLLAISFQLWYIHHTKISP